MRLFFPRLSLGTILLAGVLVAGCSDDDGTSPPATPPAPTGLQAAVQPDNSVEVSWNASAGAASYVLQRATSADPGNFTQVGGGNITATEYTDAAVTPGTNYSYRVAAVNASGVGDFSGAVAASLPGAKTATLTGFITQDRRLFADTLYTLSGYVQVTSGATLTIDPGTRLVGDLTTAGSSLWILRGAKIEAQGTAAAPIVFTSARAAGQRGPGDWGGIIIVGNGIINRTGTILTEGPTDIAKNYAGGTDNDDDSGTLEYVRIEFAGYDLSGGGNSELNGLSMYAVGRGTTLQYVQVLAGLDDSFEWWGGAVDGRYLVSYEAGDDHFDTSEGYVGRNQFLIGYQSTRLAPAAGTGVIATDPQGFEMDGCAGTGCTNGARSEPFTNPLFANFTMVGNPMEPQTSGGRAIVLRRGHMGILANGIVANWAAAATDVRDTSVTLLARDSVRIVDMVYAGNAAGNYVAAIQGSFGAANHRTATAAGDVLTSVTAPGLNFTPLGIATANCGTATLPAERTGNFFGGTLTLPTYCGAVDPAGPQWYSGWTAYYTN